MEGPGDGWKAETTLMKSDAAFLFNQLQDPGKAELSSDFARLLGALKALIQNIFCELNAIQDIES